jgi:hypothetical protein
MLGMLVPVCGAGELTADEIVGRANHVSLYQGRDSKGKVTMTLTDRQGGTRTREFNMVRRDCDGDDGDQKYFAFFQAPADVRKMVFMVHKHAAVDEEDDRWLYLPGLDLVKRIAAGDKRTSFVGSDFLYEDISGRSPLEDEHELLETTDSEYILNNVPKRPDEVEFDHYVVHVDAKTFVPVKTEFFKKGDRLYRVIEVEKVENIAAKENGREVVYPTVTRSVARNLETGTRTVMAVSGVRYDLGLRDRIFSERYLRRPPKEVMR